MDCFTIALGKKTGTTFPITFDNKHNYNALYDTGAGASLINYSAYVSLGQDLDTGYQPFVKNASGEEMGALGQVTCTFTINNQLFTQSFIVCRHMQRPVILGMDFTLTNFIGVIWTHEGMRKMIRSNGSTVMELPDTTSGIPLVLVRSIKIRPGGNLEVPLECTRQLTDQMDIRIDTGFHHKNPNIYIPPSCINNPNNKYNPRYMPLTIFNLSMVDHLYIGKDTVITFAEQPVLETYNIELASGDKIKKHLAKPRNWVPQRHETLPEIPYDTAFICSPADVPGPRRLQLQDKDITTDIRQKFEELCEEYGEAFSKNNEDIGRTKLVKMDIDTGDSPPVSSRPYTLPLKHYKWVQREIESLERAGVITKSMSKWASPIVVIPKKSAPGEPPKRRLCVDFRKVNELQQEVITAGKTKGQISIHSLPKIDEMYVKLKGAKVFSTIDLRSGYHHIALGKSSRAKTTFVMPFGKYEFLMVPFGLAQAPAYFQLLMNKVLKGLKFTMTYLDDIVIFSQDELQHLEHLEIVFSRLWEAGLKMKHSKCDFFKSKIHYLGHLISPEGISLLPNKLDSIRHMPVPNSVKEIKQFLGLTGYYRKFVPRFADISRPLTTLTKKDAKFEWTSACQKSFELLKEALCGEPVLKYADTSKPYTLYTDASKYGWAGVLTQPHTTTIDGKSTTTDHPVAFVSGLFRGSQLNWAALMKEAFAIYMSVKKLLFYLTDAQILLRSDHKPLEKFLLKNMLNSKVNNWAMELEAFNIQFDYIKGSNNILADTLSHLIAIDPDTPTTPEEPGYEFGYAIFEEFPKVQTKTYEVNEVIVVTDTEIIKNDPELQNSLQCIQNSIAPQRLRKLQQQDSNIEILKRKLQNNKLDKEYYSLDENELLMRKVIDGGHEFCAIYLPSVLIFQVLRTAHDDLGHNGFPRTYAALKRVFFWKGMKEDIRKHCKTCATCQLHKLENVKFERKIFKPSLQPMDFICMDLIGEFHPRQVVDTVMR